MKKKEYPYQNLSLKDMKGEAWEDIPGLDGYFAVSNYGRVKRMKFQMQLKDGRIVTRQEIIIKPRIQKTWNKVLKDYSYYLTTRVTYQKKYYTFGVARLVYDRFIEPIEKREYEFVVLTKDYDNFNIRLSNLLGTTLQIRSKRTFQQKRGFSPFPYLSEKVKHKREQSIIKQHSKHVTQYTLDGRKIRTFPSMIAAARAVGIAATSIGEGVAGNFITVKGFVWRLGKKKKINIDVKKLKEARRKEHRKNYHIVSVTQYDTNGNKIAHYPSLTDAEEASGVRAEHISLVARGINKSAGGYFWAKGYSKEKIDMNGYKRGKASISATTAKK